MHTYKASKITFQHNGDYSGDIHVLVPKSVTHETGLSNIRVIVPFTDILDFVLEFVRTEMIDRVEHMSRHDLLVLLGLALKIDSEDAPTQDHRSSV